MLLKNKRITITGGKGFLGHHLVEKLRKHGYDHVDAINSSDYDLTDLVNIKQMYADKRPDIIIHLAARVGGIGYNRENPATLFYTNLIMGTQLIHEGYLRR